MMIKSSFEFPSGESFSSCSSRSVTCSPGAHLLVSSRHSNSTMNWSSERNSPASEPLSNMPGHFATNPVPEAPQNSVSNLRSQVVKYSSRILRAIGLGIIKLLSMLVFALAYLIGGALRAIYFLERPQWSPLLNSGTTVSNVIKNDPIRRVEHFVQTLEDHLLPQQQFSIYNSDNSSPNLPPFFQGSYTQALYMATHRAKFLFIYITNPKCDGSQVLFDKIISNPAFVLIFARKNTLIWGGDVANPEAYELANNINITKFPMLGLLCLTRTTKMTPDGPTKSTPRTALVLKILGVLDDDVDPEAVIDEKFTSRMARYEPELALIRAELKQKFLDESLRQSQDLRYQESLRKDHLRKEEQQRQKLFLKYLKWKQPSIKSLLEATSTLGCLRVSIKFADGESNTLYFPMDATIESIFLFVELKNRDMLDKEYDVILNGAEARQFLKPAFEYGFNLITPIPPRVGLRGYDLTTEIKDLEFLHPSGRLLVDKV